MRFWKGELIGLLKRGLGKKRIWSMLKKKDVWKRLELKMLAEELDLEVWLSWGLLEQEIIF